jgi:hypothetical protein
MIVLSETKQDGIQVLHVIIGPETEFQFNLNGQSLIDISDYLQAYKEGTRVMLVVNKCNSEEELMQQLAFERAKNQANQAFKEIVQKGHIFGKPSSLKKSDPIITTPESNSKKRCPKCGKPNSAIIVDGASYPCKICQDIDLGLRSGEIPPPPGKVDINNLKTDSILHTPAQDDTLKRFIRNKLESEEAKDNDKKPPRKNRGKKEEPPAIDDETDMGDEEEPGEEDGTDSNI